MAATTTSAPSTCRDTSPSSPIGSTDDSHSARCFPGSSMSPCALRPCPTECSSWLRIMCNQEILCSSSNRNASSIYPAFPTCYHRAKIKVGTMRDRDGTPDRQCIFPRKPVRTKMPVKYRSVAMGSIVTPALELVVSVRRSTRKFSDRGGEYSSLASSQERTKHRNSQYGPRRLRIVPALRMTRHSLPLHVYHCRTNNPNSCRGLIAFSLTRKRPRAQSERTIVHTRIPDIARKRD